MTRSGTSKLGLLSAVLTTMVAAPASAETMTDKCSGEVAFTSTFDGKPTDPDTVVLKRGKSGYSPWVTFAAKTGPQGHVRWWCHSTTGNVFDPGTWRIKIDGKAIVSCLVAVPEAVVKPPGLPAPGLPAKPGSEVEKCLKVVTLGSSAFAGWTPERSRCDNRATKFRARLGPDRVLETECLGK